MKVAKMKKILNYIAVSTILFVPFSSFGEKMSMNDAIAECIKNPSYATNVLNELPKTDHDMFIHHVTNAILTASHLADEEKKSLIDEIDSALKSYNEIHVVPVVQLLTVGENEYMQKMRLDMMNFNEQLLNNWLPSGYEDVDALLLMPDININRVPRVDGKRGHNSKKMDVMEPMPYD